MPTPSIQILRTDAQQVLNLDSISAVRSVVAASLANANAGTPLNPNLTTQQLWNEFYQIVTQPKSDIESIIANQLMKFLYSPPAPGGAGADKQVIFNDGGVLAGDADFLWNKTTNLLTVTGAATITGDLTVDTNVLKVDTTNNKVGIGTTTLASTLTIRGTLQTNADYNLQSYYKDNGSTWLGYHLFRDDGVNYLTVLSAQPWAVLVNGSERYRLASDGVATWSNVGGVAGTAMTLNATGLGVGVSPSYKLDVNGNFASTVASGAAFRAIRSSSGDRCLIVPLAAGSGFTIQSQNSAESDFTPIIFSGSTTTFNYRTGVGTLAAGMTLDASGNLLVGTTSVSSAFNTKLHISSDSGTTKWAVGPYSSASNFVISAAGGGGVYLNGTAATSWTSASDERLKDIIEPISNAIAKVGSLRAVIGKFKFDQNNTRKPFLIAQDIQAVLPEAVDASNPDRLGLAYTDVIPLLVAAIKELTAEVNALKNA